MKKLNIPGLILFALLVPGCAPLPPERQDPLLGIAQPENPAYSNISLALIYSENTLRSKDYVQKWVGLKGAMGMQFPPAVTLFDDVTAIFQRNFKKVTKIDKIEDAKRGEVDAIAVLDIYPKFPAETIYEDTKIDVRAILLTLDGKPIDDVHAEALGEKTFFSTNPFKAVIQNASDEVRKRLEAALRSSPKLAEFSKSHTAIASAGKPQPSVAAVAIRSDVDSIPGTTAVHKKHAYAVVIGIEQYREKLPKADFADRDAKLVGEYLVRTMGYPEENVVVRTNDKASLTDLIKYFENWLPNNVEKDSSVFVYYSGHGAPNPKTGDAYMVPYDGDPTFVDATGYPMKRLYAALDKLPVKDVTVVLDSCFSGAGGRSVLAKGAKPMGLSVEHSLGATGRTTVLAASAGDQISSAYEEKGHGLLTYFFLKGLQGEGDLNKDGHIDMAELFDYVKPNVSKVARKQYNNEQTPQLLGGADSLKKGGRLIERSAP